ncbi:MAG: hypothetical protein ABIP78_01145 [Pyrinomonadaceae bacterium]
MKTKNMKTIALVAVLLAAATACQKASNTNTLDNKVVSNVNMPANTATPTTENTVTNSSGTPSDAYKAAYTARKTKDVPSLKKFMSKDILEFFTDIAGIGEKKQTVDDLLMELCEKPQAATAETRNEKINGDKATIEYLDEENEWQPMEFVKEDGIWKLTLEKPEKEVPVDRKDPKKK